MPPAEPPPSLPDLIRSIEWGSPVDVAAAADAGAGATPPGETGKTSETAATDAGVAVAAKERGARNSRADAGASRATASAGWPFYGGPGLFSTEPPPWAASAWTTEPTAGAGP